MEVFRICGGTSLNGVVNISGSKNAALPQFAATLLSSEQSVLRNVPNLSDVRFMAEILSELGAEVRQLDNSTWEINPANITHNAPYELVRKMRASICLLGPLVGRLKKAEIPMPGGCVIGQRPIDLHIKALSRLGANIELKKGIVKVDGKNLRGNKLFLGGRHGSTVTGTSNAIMAAVLAPGLTTIDSSACEPEISDLCSMLISMGAKISGVGSHRLEIEGVNKLSGCNHRVIPDRIEAATYAIAAAITQGEVTLNGAKSEHLGSFINVMQESGVSMDLEHTDQIKVYLKNGELNSLEIITLPYPGFPTDLQAQSCALACKANGLSILTERVYPSRFMHVPELMRMGADIAMEGASSVVKGKSKLTGAPVMASDLRASAALILAGLAAEGESWVQRIYHLDRGYDAFEKKLQALGAIVERVPENKLPKSFSTN
ncbi:MAG: UDP-N-acetylglucosamine 1-carboxyvinyltransferase [Opitutae bacterium]|nr:UDP-N-acetylglucosamine 1-carboxyvinyltransferase [Opitutae bacterium]